LSLFGPFSTRASADASCTAVLVQPESAELLQRIEGQSRDVACALLTVAADPVPEGDGCKAFAEAHGAQGVLIVRGRPEDASSYEVVVCGGERAAEHRAVKAQGASGDALSTSALYEAVALVVRSALVELAEAFEQARLRAQEEAARAEREAQRAEEEARRARQVRERERAEREMREAEEAEEPDEPEGPYHPPSLANPDWLVLVGIDVAAIGAERASLELGLRAQLDLGVIVLGAFGSFGLPAPLRDASTRVELARHRGGVLAGLPLRLTRAVVLEPLVLAGAAAIVRSSESRAEGVAAARDATTWSALFGAELGLSLQLAGPFGVRVHGALEVLPGAPRYVYEDVLPDTTLRTERTPAHPLQPRAGATLFGRF
jgi:hypothetical protein